MFGVRADGAAVVSCGTIPPMAVPVRSYAIAATDSEVGLAEVGYNDSDGMTLSFRRLTPSLDTASSTTLLDTSRPGPLAGAYVEASRWRRSRRAG